MERRSYLRALGGVGALALAGCVDELDDGPGTPTENAAPGDSTATDDPTATEEATPTGEATPGDDATPTSGDDATPTPDDETTPTPDGSTDDDSTSTGDASPGDDSTDGASAADDSTRTLSIYAYPGNEPARYEFTVSGDLAQTDAYGATVDDHDTVDGSTATGHVWGMMDSYRFTGDVMEFEVSRQVKVVLDGEAVDPGDLGTTTGYDLETASADRTH